jgi:hypothetical protein
LLARLLSLIALGLPIVSGCSEVEEYRFDRRFQRVEPGMTRAEVEALLGPPDAVWTTAYPLPPPDPLTFGPGRPPGVDSVRDRLVGPYVDARWGTCSTSEPGFPQREYRVVFGSAPPAPVVVAWGQGGCGVHY